MKNLWISAAVTFFILASSLSAKTHRELRGEVFHRGKNGNPVPERGLIVTLTESEHSDDTNDLGIFRLPLGPEFRPGDPITISVDKPGWRIRYPLNGELLVPRDLRRAIQVELLPVKSPQFLSDDGWVEKLIRDTIDRSKENRRQQPVDLGFYVEEWAARYGFSPQEVQEQIDRWSAKVDARRNDSHSQGLSAVAKQQFDKAAERFHDSAEWHLRKRDETRKQQKKLAARDAEQSEQAVRDFRLEAALHFRAYRYPQALAVYERAHQLTSSEETPQLWVETLNDVGDLHRELGSWGPPAESADHLSQAVTAFHQALSVATQERLPQYWAATENNLANALLEQGSRAGGETGDQLFAQAIAIFRQVLLMFTQDQTPHKWALAQLNLGTALQKQGAKIAGESGNKLLVQAIDAFRQALLVLTPERIPQDWASTQNNLGIALQDLGGRTEGEAGEQLIAQAIDAYRKALPVYAKDKATQDWVTTQNNLGTALRDQGLRTTGESSNRLLSQAVETFRQASLASTLPQLSAITYYNIGLALKDQGIRTTGEPGMQLLAQAVDAFRQTLLIYHQDTFPQPWAETQNYLGLTLKELGVRTAGDSGNQFFIQAADAYRQALHVFTRDQLPEKWAMTQSNLAAALGHLGDGTPGEPGDELLAQASDIYRQLLLVRTREQMPQEWAIVQTNLGAVLQAQSLRASGDAGHQLLLQALDAMQKALLVFTPSNMPYAWQLTRGNEASVLLDLGRNQEAIQALTQIFELDSTDRQTFLSLVTALTDRLFDPQKAMVLSRDWLQRHPDDREARGLYSEELLAAKDFAAWRKQVSGVLSPKDEAIEPATRIIFLAYSVAIDLETDGPGTRNRIEEMITIAALQPPEFKTSRKFSGILHSLEVSPKPPYGEVMARLFRALEAPNRDTLIQGLREIPKALRALAADDQ